MRYLVTITSRTAGSRAVIAAAMRASVASGIAVIRHIAAATVSIGLIGTTLGFIVALNGIDMSGAASASAVGARVGHLVDGMSVALYSTLVGAVLGLWLILNYYILVRESTRFVSALVTLGEPTTDPMVSDLKPRVAAQSAAST